MTDKQVINFCKNVGILIPFSFTLLVTGAAGFKPGSGATGAAGLTADAGLSTDAAGAPEYV